MTTATQEKPAEAKPAEAPYEDVPYEPNEGTWLEAFLLHVYREVGRAKHKFPGNEVTGVALLEEAGELAKAALNEPGLDVWKEAVQTAAMAARMAIDGDDSIAAWRKARGLDPMDAEHCKGDPDAEQLQPKMPAAAVYKHALYQVLTPAIGDTAHWVSVTPANWEKAKKAGMKTRELMERVN